MIQTYQHWKVRPHGKLSKVDEGILTVTGPILEPSPDAARPGGVPGVGQRGHLGTPRTALSILRPRLASLTRLE